MGCRRRPVPWFQKRKILLHPVQIKLEQDAWFDGKTVRYIGGRQTEWHVIR